MQSIAANAEGDVLNKEQAKRIKSQVSDTKRNIFDLKAKVCIFFLFFFVYEL